MSLSAFRLLEDRQQDDAPTGCDPVGDPGCSASEIEAQLTELSIELLRVRFIEQMSFLFESVDVEVDAALLVIIQHEVPVSNLWLDFDLSP